ncbi:MoxR family ATPase [Streptomyces poriferorum]|uniref:MoxR family ATPase n=1 Tax=Streptomyces poriferorum TaxID=2798799 RepID=A0ABY9IM63_9ACTN|nr:MULTISPECIES: MoxR family ATPase [unclassified Streptomyces]WSQ43764.1 MoxR family ATPase [Streptomyces sp. NBC_01220]MDP5314695.1 MoxR family ATPase [Streptomyces sp. Alt4]WLQ50931.1 MoxR family ATPase [Streptomyces sp. Alt1]WLQ56405.1 MoxR family ATPase [Streptomyces sp. Alt2]WSI65744.1 MoxR family ATPase [Streptomyces sp. NBC_01336]
MSEPSEWLIYRGIGEPHDEVAQLPPPPPWRDFAGASGGADGAESADRRLGIPGRIADEHRPGAEELEMINAALYLRRPLLVTGDPGAGKSTLAHSVARELEFGKVLRWPVVSRTTLLDGLYHYDAIARLQDVQIASHAAAGGGGAGADSAQSVGSYIRLGPLGTALLPSDRPRVLLIDELDKSDIDLPNDLLNVLEEGEFAIPELERIADRLPDGEADVLDHDGNKVRIKGGRVQCRAFPFVVLTSNGERDFPAPLMRRCIHLELGRPDHKRLAAFVKAHLGEEAARSSEDLITLFLERSRSELLATDQLLNAIYLTQAAAPTGRDRLADLLIQRLDRPR